VVDTLRLIIFYHGGGFFFGSSRTHRVIGFQLGARIGKRRTGARLPFWLRKIRAPAAHDDAFAVYQWALKQGYASGKVA